MSNGMKLSHVLYKVKDLHEAVKDFEDMGFTVRYGTKKEKAFNALIWFEEGPFIELFTIGSGVKGIMFLLKLIGKSAVAKRFEYFIDADYGWVEYSLENDRFELDVENMKFREIECKYSTLKASRNNINGLKLKWKLSIPLDLSLPFLMSAYNINPRPKYIKHRNGSKSVSTLTWGTSAKNIEIISELTNDTRLKLEEGSGFKRIEFDDWNTELLNRKYYK